MARSQDPPARSRFAHRLIAWCVIAFALFVGAWGARAWVLHLAVRAGLDTVDSLFKHLPSPVRDTAPRAGELFPLWPLHIGEEGGGVDEVVAEVALGARPKARATSMQAPRVRPRPPEPQSVRAPVALVLKWAAQRLVPRGVVRSASPGIPAGIELHGVGALGIGLIDGDRLVTVDGISVQEREKVVEAVLGARARRAESMTAGLVRVTALGPRPFAVVVEQPYPEDVSQARNQDEVVDGEQGGEVFPAGEDGAGSAKELPDGGGQE